MKCLHTRPCSHFLCFFPPLFHSSCLVTDVMNNLYVLKFLSNPKRFPGITEQTWCSQEVVDIPPRQSWRAGATHTHTPGTLKWLVVRATGAVTSRAAPRISPQIRHPALPLSKPTLQALFNSPSEPAQLARGFARAFAFKLIGACDPGEDLCPRPALVPRE